MKDKRAQDKPETGDKTRSHSQVSYLWNLVNKMDWSKARLEKDAKEAIAQREKLASEAATKKAWANAPHYKPSPNNLQRSKKTDAELLRAPLNDLSVADMLRLYGLSNTKNASKEGKVAPPEIKPNCTVP